MIDWRVVFLVSVLPVMVVVVAVMMRPVRAATLSVDDACRLLPQSVTEIEQRVPVIIDVAERAIARLKALPIAEYSYASVIRPFDQARIQFERDFFYFMVAMSCHPDAAVRMAATHAMGQLSGVRSSLFETPAIYALVKRYAYEVAPQEVLSAEERFYLDKLMDRFVSDGYELPAEQFEAVLALRAQEEQLQNEGEYNLGAHTPMLRVSAGELEGMPDAFVQRTRVADTDECAIAITMLSYAEISRSCRNRAVRERAWRLLQEIGMPDNGETLKRLLEVRQKIARTLGYQSYAEYSIRSKMAGSATRVATFLNELGERALEPARQHMQQLLQTCDDQIPLDAEGRVAPWDEPFLADRYIAKNYNLNRAALAEYFPVEQTLQRIFSVYEQFLQLEIRTEHPTAAWHSTVSAVSVWKAGELRGYLLLDLFSRAGKQTAGFCAPLLPSMRDSKTHALHPGVAALVFGMECRGTAGVPALLQHHDVTTLFHEIGHGMHTLLSDMTLHGTSGIPEEANDYFEMPSQLFEEFGWDAQILRRVSGHYQTGEPLPEEVIATLTQVRTKQGVADLMMRIAYAQLSLQYHSTAGSSTDLMQTHHQIWQRYLPWRQVMADDTFPARATHLFGYKAAVYAYLWSQVYALDILECVRERGVQDSCYPLLNPRMGTELSAKLFATGDGADLAEQLRLFLGREPRQDAFLKLYGVR